MDQKKAIARLLRLVAELVERAPSTDVEDVILGRSELVICRVSETPALRNGSRQRDVEKRRNPSSRDLSPVVAQLRSLGSREAGFALLSDLGLSRRELEAMARLMDLPVIREDDADQLRRKIVEDGIGARLNSQAIRGQ